MNHVPWQVLLGCYMVAALTYPTLSTARSNFTFISRGVQAKLHWTSKFETPFYRHNIMTSSFHTWPDEDEHDSMPPKISPWNGLLRFSLELTSLVSIGHFGYSLPKPVWAKCVLAGLLPITAGAAWVILNVPGDPSRSGEAPVPVSGKTRLAVELSILGFGGYVLGLWSPPAGGVYAGLTMLHYASYRERLYWLWKQQ